MGNHTTYTTVRAGDKYAYEKANKDAGWELNPKQGTKSKKKMDHRKQRGIFARNSGCGYFSPLLS